MSMGYQINTDDEFVTIRIEGDAELVHICELAKAIISDPDYRPAYSQLVDLRGAILAPKHEDLEALTRLLLEDYRSTVTASIAVVVDQSIERGLCAGIYWLCCAMGTAELFDNYDLALKWLIQKEFSIKPIPSIAATKYPQ